MKWPTLQAGQPSHKEREMALCTFAMQLPYKSDL